MGPQHERRSAGPRPLTSLRASALTWGGRAEYDTSTRQSQGPCPSRAACVASTSTATFVWLGWWRKVRDTVPDSGRQSTPARSAQRRRRPWRLARSRAADARRGRRRCRASVKAQGWPAAVQRRRLPPRGATSGPATRRAARASHSRGSADPGAEAAGARSTLPAHAWGAAPSPRPVSVRRKRPWGPRWTVARHAPSASAGEARTGGSCHVRHPRVPRQRQRPKSLVSS